MGRRIKKSVSVDLDVIVQGEDLAGRQDRSFSRIVEHALIEYIKRHGGDKQPAPIVSEKESKPVRRRRTKTPSSPPSLKVPPSSPPKRKSRTVPQDPPSPDETLGYMLSIGGSEKEAANFHDYWSDQGWRRNGGPMRDWKGSARMWHRNQRDGVRAGGKKGGVSVNYNFPADEHKNPRF
jgi:hypothetical protein